MDRQSNRTRLVLVADDSAEDRFLLREAMRRANQLEIIGEVSDGAEVIAFLKRASSPVTRERNPMPDLLLLDLKMPVKDGFEVLEWLRTRPFPELTVVVLTDSMHPEHIKRALDLGADLFQVKPATHGDRATMILSLEERLLLSRPVLAHAHLLPATVA